MMTKPRTRLSGILATVLLSVTGLVACATGISAGSLTVLATWTGAEETAFRLVLKGFADETGIKVNYTGTRAVNQVLSADVQKGQPPDIAVLPSLGELARYVRSGDVHPVDGILGDRPGDSYSAQWLQLQQAGTEKLYAVPVKAELKSIIWYNPVAFAYSPPTTWDQLTAIANDLRSRGETPWCLGMGATPVSGWPGTDWIEDILLHQAGPNVYQRWAAGTLPWTSPEVKQAWTTWGGTVTTPGSVRGGSTSALLTDFGDAGKPMFTSPPGCSLEHQASFRLGDFRNISRGDAKLAPGKDFTYFTFPGFGATPAGLTEVSADLAAMFRPSDNALKLMAYLADVRGQRVWPSHGSAFSVNKKVLAQNVYTDGVSTGIAHALALPASTLCFDASDLMPATMSDAFSRAVLEYLSNPARLDGLLDSLEKVRAGIPAEDRLNVACGG